MKYLCLHIRYISSVYHGKSYDGGQEWPPSPYRVFQALVSAAGHEDPNISQGNRNALEYLENRIPYIIAPKVLSDDTRYVNYVPNNSKDLMIMDELAGKAIDLRGHISEKLINPVIFEDGVIQYLYLIDDDFEHLEVIEKLSRSVGYIGSGKDKVAADAFILDIDNIQDIALDVFKPTRIKTKYQLRIPINGTLRGLIAAHKSKISTPIYRGHNRNSDYYTIYYMNSSYKKTDTTLVYKTMDPNKYNKVKAFDLTYGTTALAGMLRHSLNQLAFESKLDPLQISSFINGKNFDGSILSRSDSTPDRFSYIAIPTISYHDNKVGDIRRIILLAPDKCVDEIKWAKNCLNNTPLTNNGITRSILKESSVYEDQWIMNQYLGEHKKWCTVTPVILPEHTNYSGLMSKADKARTKEDQEKHLNMLHLKTMKAIFKAFIDAGYSENILRKSKINYSYNIGFKSGVLSVNKYKYPEEFMNTCKVHIEIEFPDSVPGLIVIGRGKYRGLGLFVNNV